VGAGHRVDAGGPQDMRRASCVRDFTSSFPTSKHDAAPDPTRAVCAYMASGHIPVVEEDSVIIEFSPLGEYQKTMAAFEGDE
jgi:hypothetical protein